MTAKVPHVPRPRRSGRSHPPACSPDQPFVWSLVLATEAGIETAVWWDYRPARAVFDRISRSIEASGTDARMTLRYVHVDCDRRHDTPEHAGS